MDRALKAAMLERLARLAEDLTVNDPLRRRVLDALDRALALSRQYLSDDQAGTLEDVRAYWELCGSVELADLEHVAGQRRAGRKGG